MIEVHMATYLITGANRGFGYEYCRQLQARGETVIAVCRSASQELQQLGIQVEEAIATPTHADIRNGETSLTSTQAVVTCAYSVVRNGEAVVISTHSVVRNGEAVPTYTYLVVRNDEAVVTNDKAVVTNALQAKPQEAISSL
jgi:NAD(P)-dependent dehydrogenase (short-subunit alcohol dehydrogenase family)